MWFVWRTNGRRVQLNRWWEIRTLAAKATYLSKNASSSLIFFRSRQNEGGTASRDADRGDRRSVSVWLGSHLVSLGRMGNTSRDGSKWSISLVGSSFSLADWWPIYPLSAKDCDSLSCWTPKRFPKGVKSTSVSLAVTYSKWLYMRSVTRTTLPLEEWLLSKPNACSKYNSLRFT